jgi:acetolactate synthase-1/2/3 large subunit
MNPFLEKPQGFENMTPQMTGAEILVRSLKDLEVTCVFGYPGAAILPVFHALAKAQIQIIVNSNEQSCAFSAAGYSRSGDKVGVAIVTSGPAITNTLTAVADSNADSIPILVFAGQVPQRKLGTDEFQHINVTEVFAKAAKKVILITDNSDVEVVVKDSYFLAQSGKPGPVVIDFPLDAQRKTGCYREQDPNVYRLKYEDESHLGKNQCRDFFELLQHSSRPLLYIGGGLNSKAGSERIREFNRMFNIPSINSIMGKGILDEGLDTSLGMLGMFGTPYSNMAIQETDLFVAFGVRWDDRVAQRVGDPGLEADIAYFDINAEKVQEVRLTRKPKFSFIGDAKIALKDLLEYARENNIRLDIKEWQERVSYLKRAFQLNYKRKAEAIQQAEVMDLLSDLLTEQTKITTGVGNHQMLAAQYLKILQPKSFFTASGFGTMGFALPCAIGVHCNNPEATVIAIDGDSSIKMNMGEMHTIGALGIPIKVMLLNNHGDGMVRNIQDADYQGLHTATERSFDANFARIAKECGFSFCRRIEHRTNLEASLREFLAATGPSLLEIVTDRNEVVYPKIPVGKGYKDMILGPFIKNTLASESGQKGIQ